MKTAFPHVTVAAFALLCATSVSRAEDEPQSKHMKEMLRAKLAEEAKKQASAPAPAPSPATSASPSAASAPAADTKAAEPPATTSAAKPKTAPAKTAQQPATMLPQVEVKKDRITVLDQQIAKQEQDIAREKKNTKPTETDLALNDLKVAKPLAIFGGESTQFRQHVANERVELMEAEQDILEAMKLAKTKAEKDKLQHELDQLRAMRRDLEKALR